MYRIAADGSTSTIIGTGIRGFSGDGGPAIAAEISGTRAITTDPSGIIYLADASRVRRVDSAGIITTIAGTGGFGSTGDGGPASEATFNGIEHLAMDPQGRLLVAEYGRLRRIEGGIITTVASGLFVRGLVAEPDGSIVVSEQHRITRIAAGGATSTTIAGTGVAGFAGDGGPATSALLNAPGGLARDPSGNLYIADLGNRRVRRLAMDGTITTIAGTGIYGAGGDDGPAVDLDLTSPMLSTDAAGQLFMLNAQAGRWQELSTGTQLPLADLYHDPVSDRPRMSHDGFGLVYTQDRWQHAPYAAPGPSTLAPAPLGGGIVAYETRSIGTALAGARSWRVDAPTWEVTEAAPAPGPVPGALLSYDWVRQAVVLVGGSTAGRRDTYLNRDASWSLLAGAAPLPAGDPSALGFDPELPGMILVHAGRVLTLGSTASAWMDLGAVASVIGGTPRSFGYDPTSRVLFALSDAGQLWERRAGTWSLSPFALNTPGYRLVADERRGIVMALPLGGRDRRWFEYRGGWVEGGVLPREVNGTIASDPRHGRMVILGDGSPTEPSGYTFMLIRTSRSGLSEESCVEGEDGDGDGRGGCADGDCFWLCDRCPPYTSCP